MIDATHHEVIGLMSQAGTMGSVSLRIQRKMPQTGICIPKSGYYIRYNIHNPTIGIELQSIE